VGAGISDPDDANIAILEFLPETITVEAGTDVTWEWSGAEPHSVSFVPEGQDPPNVEEDPSAVAPVPATGPIDGSAFVSSGLQPLGPTAPAPFEASFATAGTYPYLCLIHPGMTGVVEVVDAGGAADTPTDVAERRAADTADYLAEGQAAKAELVGADPEKTDNGDGTSTWTVQMGTTTEHTDVLAFAPSPAGVKAGDTVTFVNSSGAPHTASFFGTGAEALQDPFDPKVVQPSGPSPQELSAAGYINTGWLLPDVGPPLEARSFSFTVPEAGTYAYVCILHAPSEMTGSIEAS
jgi:plastocyanin